MRDEPLTAARVGPRIERHADRPAQIRTLIELVTDRITRSTLAVAARIAILDDEVGDDAMEAQAVEVAAPREGDEVLDRQRRVDDRELDLNQPAIGFEVDL